MNKQRVYLSGPITGEDDQQTMAKFYRVEMSIKGQGCAVFNPLRNGLARNAPWERHMAVDIKQLEACDTMFMLDGWEKSQGSVLELNMGLIYGKTIYFETLPIQELMEQIVGVANEMRQALLIDERLMFEPKFYAEQCIKAGFYAAI